VGEFAARAGSAGFTVEDLLERLNDIQSEAGKASQLDQKRR